MYSCAGPNPRRILPSALLAVATVHCGSAREIVEAVHESPVVRPVACVEANATTAVQALLDDPANAAICLAPGRYRGPWVISRPTQLWGSRDAIVGATGGTIIDVRAPGAAVLGLTVDGTGARFDKLDGAVRVTANDVRVEGVTVVNAVFGILVEGARRAAILGNHIQGSRDPALGLRGDTIRIWATHDSRVEDNVMYDGRDMVVWYSSNNAITRNRVDGGRYGIHFMYSHNNRVEGNQLLRGVVGIFVMYSRGVKLVDNLIADAAGAAGMGIGVKDSGNIEVIGNRLIHNTLGLYVDSSPMQRGEVVTVRSNVLRLNDVGVVFHSSAHNLSAHDNDFADNQVQIRVDGGGDATGVDWQGNYFDDYAGFDLDGDTIGDVAYQMRSLSNELTSQRPELAVLRGTIAMAVVDAAGHLDPLYQPKPILTDPKPRMSARHPSGEMRALPTRRML
jgi:nitrous oxidase accessory protein